MEAGKPLPSSSLTADCPEGPALALSVCQACTGLQLPSLSFPICKENDRNL